MDGIESLIVSPVGDRSLVVTDVLVRDAISEKLKQRGLNAPVTRVERNEKDWVVHLSSCDEKPETRRNMTMENELYARLAYEAYCEHTGWKSLATGADLPRWDVLNDSIKQAWGAAAKAITAQLA